MPLYEYECQKCHRRVEKIQSFSAAPLTTCEHCGGPLEKLISAPAIQFKGSGWYVTDYAKSSASPAKPAAANGSAATESKPDTSAAAAAAPAAAAPEKSEKKSES